MRASYTAPWLFLLCLSLCDGFSASEESASGDAIANTDCGQVQGLQVAKDSAYVFRGIPYAEPPVGKMRWTPPTPISPANQNCWNGTLPAQKFGNACYQKDDLNTSLYIGSEDCLYLNVWTPDPNPAFPLPVMFWIHGGYLIFGNGNMQDVGYAPTPKLAKDTQVVFVSLNYRLHAFGFMALEWLTGKSVTNTTGNYGFMDMIVALQWVQRNIHNFGGDPSKVTIFGQSSGGTSVFALLTSPLSKGLFSKAWSMSGSPVINKTAEDACRDNQAFVANTKCSNVECLYSLSAHDVTSAVPWEKYPYWAMEDQCGLPINGHFDGALAIVDGHVLREAPFQAWLHGDGVDVPFMIGSTAQEVDMLPVPPTVSSWTWPEGNYQRFVGQTLGTFSPEVVLAAFKFYPPDVGTPELQYTTMASDLRVTCGTHYLGLLASLSFTSPVYRYVANYRPSSPGKYFGFDFEAKYAAHGIDMYGYFETMNILLGETATTSDMEWEANMQREILAFIKDGRPASVDWKPYPESTAVLSTNTTVAKAYHADECEFWLANGFFSYSWIN